MEAKAQYIQGYYRNVASNEPTKKEDNTILAFGLLIGTGVLFAIIYIQLTLIVGASFGAAYLAKTYVSRIRQQQALPQLVVNQSGKSKVIYLDHVQSVPAKEL